MGIKEVVELHPPDIETAQLTDDSECTVFVQLGRHMSARVISRELRILLWHRTIQN